AFSIPRMSVGGCLGQRRILSTGPRSGQEQSRLEGPGDPYRGRHASAASATGAASVRLSIMSSTPPNPGIHEAESFTPAARLRSDSTRSPKSAAPETRIPNGMNLRPESALERIAREHAPATATERSRPPAVPARVLPGLTDGASFGPPSALPA